MRITGWHNLWLILFTVSRGVAQQSELAYTALPLQNLNEFRPVGSNWKLVSDVFYDVNKTGGGQTKSGGGILVNDPSGKSKEHLFTKLEHGDLDLELDFMMEKGSNSGVYLQGRYEVQLFDSWGVKEPKSSDCGAIYQRWDDSRPEGRKGYEGHPPAQNVSRAPGLWQHLKISFRAPRFNQKGEKIANARFVNVVLNGVPVQQTIEVTGPTRSAAFQDEKPTGPLMIQGDHGPVAIRTIRYKAYSLESVTLSKLRLSAYDGTVKSLDEIHSRTPKLEQAIDGLAHQTPGSKDNFAGKISGTLHIPSPGEYLFNLNLRWILPNVNTAIPNGAGELKIDGKKIIEVSNKTDGVASSKLTLQTGDYPVEITYFKSFGKRSMPSNDILLAVEGPGVQYTTLTSVVEADAPVSQITVLAKEEPVMQRGFINHHGRKHTHTISVGEPDHINYTVDLQKGEFLQIWRGDFLETTPMWRGRGESQLSVPLGSLVELSGKPSLAFLTDQNTVWPDSNATYDNLGYDVDAAGRPVFKYALGTAQVRESFASTDEGRKLLHSFTVTSAPQDIWCRVAEGHAISQLPNGLYAINDKQYFIELPKNGKPIIRTTATNTKELLLPIKSTSGASAVTYSIIW
ncbi:family 16 glycoside hydrolase [Spirosoma fluviale]|uniref:PA14 domain-containing protein n=1 Tax=Spirosoma fluviale TaxID=1597977 RepID=A0A286G476_9BACT|nr:family 16 glycoside hydrolase [Spirosoma fluviale]SOD90350.1 PA14 domain-containing protein [Spirosoma fluviale]